MTLRKGDRGEAVKAAQNHLIRCHHLLPKWGPDGIPGTETFTAARNFEAWRRLRPSPENTISARTLSALASAEPYARGVDVSKHQGTIDWPAVRAHGISFAYVKATEGASYRDPAFAQNWEGARAAGILRGAYHFFRSNVDPTLQAKNLLQTAGGGEILPCIDVEETKETKNAGANLKAVLAVYRERLDTILSEVERLLGRPPLVYTSARVIREFGLKTVPALSSCPLWVVWWSRKAGPVLPPTHDAWTLWQTGYTGGVPGFSGDVDMDFAAPGALELLRLEGACIG